MSLPATIQDWQSELQSTDVYGNKSAIVISGWTSVFPVNDNDNGNAR